MTKKILTVLFIALTFFIFSENVFAQSLTFCEQVDKNGNPVSPSSVFNIGSSGGYLDMLVNIPFDLNCMSGNYNIYVYDSNNSLLTSGSVQIQFK